MKFTFYAYINGVAKKMSESFDKSVAYDAAIEILTAKYGKIRNVEFVFI